MTPERWRQIEDLYNLARDHGDWALEGADPDKRRESSRCWRKSPAG